MSSSDIPLDPMRNLLPAYMRTDNICWLEYSIPKRAFKLILLEKALLEHLNNILIDKIILEDDFRPIYVGESSICSDFQRFFTDLQQNPKSYYLEYEHYLKKMQDVLSKELIALEYSISQHRYHSENLIDIIFTYLKEAMINNIYRSNDYKPIFIGTEQDCREFGEVLRTVNKKHL